MSKHTKSNSCYEFDNLRHLLRDSDERKEYAVTRALLTVAASLQEKLDERGLKRSELAGAMGRSRSFVTQILNGSRNVTIATLAECLAALDLELKDIEVKQLGTSSVEKQTIDHWLDGRSVARVDLGQIQDAVADAAASDCGVFAFAGEEAA